MYRVKNVRSIIENTEITEEQADFISNTLDKYFNLYNEVLVRSKSAAKKLVQKVHMLSILPVIEDMDADTVIEFFNDMPEEYKTSCSNGTNSSANVKKRVDILKEYVR